MHANIEVGHIPNLPKNEGGPLFNEPWQLTAFGVVLAMHKNGVFEWPEWVRFLSTEVASGENYGTDDLNEIYYRQWLAALEKLVTEKNLATSEELAERKDEWRFADEHRGFGEALTLGHHHDHEHNHGHHHHHHDHPHTHNHPTLGAPIAVDQCKPARARRAEA
jgi:nitrile hydratase accessory protein